MKSHNSEPRTGDEVSLLESFITLPSFEQVVASPNGDTVAFFSDRTGRTEVYFLNVTTGSVEQITDGTIAESTRYPLFWSADSRSVYFHHDTDGDEQNDIYRIDHTGTVETIIEKDGRLVLHDIADSGELLLYTSSTDRGRNLFCQNLSNGRSTQVTNFGRRTMSAAFDPAGKMVAFSVASEGTSSGTETYVGNADGSDLQELDIGDDASRSMFRKWGPEGRRLLLSDDAEGLTTACIYDVVRKELRRFDDSQHEELPFAFLPDGGGFVGVRFERANTVPFVRYVDGRCADLRVSPGVCKFPVGSRTAAFLDDQRVLVIRSAPNHRRELLAYDLMTSESVQILSAGGSESRHRFVDATRTTYEAPDGTTIGGILYESGTIDGPGIVMVHGGPHEQSYRTFDPYIQYLVSAGYTVFQPNYRGSSGRGIEFRTAIQGDWGGVEQDDIAAAGRWLTERPTVDPNRLAVYGRSFGGFSVYHQLTHYPELWRAGIAWGGVTDLLSLYDESSPAYRSFLRTEMGDPETNEKLWQERSPLMYVDRQEHPILILHGQNDPRCPVTQARRYRDALQNRGWTEGEDFEYLEFESEGHDAASTDTRRQVFERTREFLEERM